MQDLIILTHDEYTALRQSLHDIDVDLCYSAASSSPLRMRWSPERVHEKTVRAAIAERRPDNASFRIAVVQVTKPGNRHLRHGKKRLERGAPTQTKTPHVVFDRRPRSGAGFDGDDVQRVARGIA